MCSGRRQHIYVQRHAQTCTHMHTHLRVVEYMCKYVCVCVWVFMSEVSQNICTNMRTYIHICTYGVLADVYAEKKSIQNSYNIPLS